VQSWPEPMVHFADRSRTTCCGCEAPPARSTSSPLRVAFEEGDVIVLRTILLSVGRKPRVASPCPIDSAKSYTACSLRFGGGQKGWLRLRPIPGRLAKNGCISVPVLSIMRKQHAECVQEPADCRSASKPPVLYQVSRQRPNSVIPWPMPVAAAGRTEKTARQEVRRGCEPSPPSGSTAHATGFFLTGSTCVL